MVKGLTTTEAMSTLEPLLSKSETVNGSGGDVNCMDSGAGLSTVAFAEMFKRGDAELSAKDWSIMSCDGSGSG